MANSVNPGLGPHFLLVYLNLQSFAADDIFRCLFLAR